MINLMITSSLTLMIIAVGVATVGVLSTIHARKRL